MEKYQKVELWKQRGFISENLDLEMQINLANNLQHAKDILMCKKILSNDYVFYSQIEHLLYPIVVHYTQIKKNIIFNSKSIIHLFIDFCENNLKIKVNYDLEKYDEDYRLITDFINTHSMKIDLNEVHEILYSNCQTINENLYRYTIDLSEKIPLDQINKIISNRLNS